MRIRALTVLRIFGIPVRIDYSWLIIFFLIMYSMAEGYFPTVHRQFSTQEYWLMGFIAAFLLFVSVLLHELAHSFVARKQGIEVTSIRLFLFGGVSQISSEPRSGRHEFLIALAGPALSMVLALIFGAIFFFTLLQGKLQAAGLLAMTLCYANFTLALFNMIPGFPLDGGRILRAILWDRWNDMARATRVVSQIGNAVALFLMILGVVQFAFRGSLISALWLIFIGLFMKQSSTGSYQSVVIKQALAGLEVRQVMTENIASVGWLTPVNELVQEHIYKYHFTDFPVLNGDELLGMVTLAQVKALPKELWVFKQVRDIMTPIEEVTSLKPNDSVTDALSQMIVAERDRMPVIENDRLVGIVSRRDIMQLFKIKTELGVA